MELVRQLAGLSVSHIRQFRDDDSYVDRLSHRYTTTLCVVFAILVTTKQYAGMRKSMMISILSDIETVLFLLYFLSRQAIQSIVG